MLSYALHCIASDVCSGAPTPTSRALRALHVNSSRLRVVQRLQHLHRVCVGRSSPCVCLADLRAHRPSVFSNSLTRMGLSFLERVVRAIIRKPKRRTRVVRCSVICPSLATLQRAECTQNRRGWRLQHQATGVHRASGLLYHPRARDRALLHALTGTVNEMRQWDTLGHTLVISPVLG